jgi:aminoglycoside phosphotransferase (APT) family kinase protein
LKIAEGREAEVFVREDGRVLKLFREAAFAGRAERELAALGALAAAGVAAPTAHEIVAVDGRPGLVMDRIEGVDLLSRLSAQPALVFKAARTLADAHTAMHEVTAPTSLPLLNDEMRERIGAATALPRPLADFALGVLSGLDQGDRLCHGDFHVGNLLGEWDAPVIIDWGDASRGDPVADVARTRLLHRFGELPDGMSAALQRLAKVGRGVLVGRYSRIYEKARRVDKTQLRRWEVVRAAARFYEGIESEYASLTKFLERHVSVSGLEKR